MSVKHIAASDEIAELLRDAIISGELKPRERLIEMDLSARYNVSRTPIREAIRNLEAAGLVKLIPYKGAIVADVDVAEIQSIYEVRATLEGMATRLATPNMTPQLLDALERLVGDMERSAEAEQATEFTRYNDEFHQTIYKHSGNKVLAGIIDDLLDRSVIFRRAASRSRQNIANSNRDHREMLEAMRRGDARRAQEVAERHVRLFLRRELAAK